MPPLGFVLLPHRGPRPQLTKREPAVLRREHRHDARRKKEEKKNYNNGRTGGSKNKSTLTVSQRPAPADSAPSRSPARHTLRGPGPPSREGGRACLPLIRPDSPGAPLQRTADSGGPAGGSRGAGNDTTSSASGTCRTARSAPGAPAEGQGETATARPTGEARAARRRDAPSPPRGGAPATTQAGKGERRVSAASERPRA